MHRRLTGLVVATAIAIGGVLSGVAAAETCPVQLPQGSDPVALNPADFVGRIDNAYWPMSPGTRWVYRETSPDAPSLKVNVRVKSRTKEILGIDATVVRDTVTQRGQLVEDTIDWYAQDLCGNVWYLGENTKEYENGQVTSTAGSWEAGVDGGQAGVIVVGDPQVGVAYREEYLAGQAEDRAEIMSLTEQAEAPFGHFEDALLTKNTTPLQPRIVEYKLYAKGVGPVLILGVSGGNDREELISFSPPAA
jgi:hypothetical protein